MSLVAHWKLDDASGTAAVDSVGGLYGATLQNFLGSEWSADRRIGDGCLPFVAASSQYARVLSSPPAIGSGNFSISFWVKTTQVMAGYYTEMISKGDWVTGAWTVQCNYTTSCVGFLVEGENAHAQSSVLINDGKWHHIVGAMGSTQSHLYIDGVDSATGTRGGVSVAGGEIQFATAIFRPGRYLDGTLDDIQYYDHELSQLEVTALFIEPMTRKLRTSGGDFTTGQGFFDWLGNANNPLPTIMCPLQQDITLNVEGDVVFGTPSNNMMFDYGILTGESFNGHTVIIQTDPAERATPAALLGTFYLQKQNVETVESLFILKDLLLAREANQVRIVYENTNGKISIQIKNCVGYLRSVSEDYVKIIVAGGVVTNTLINNSSFFATKSESQLVDIYPMQCGSGNLTGIIRNSFIGVCSVNSAAVLHLYANAHNNNTVYDYRDVAVTVDLISGATAPDIVSSATDPLLTDAVIQAFDDSIPTMMARNAKQLASSGLVDTGDLATAETDDINGNSRP